MKLLFVDESERNRKKFKYYFVILGTIIDKNDLLLLEHNLLEFKNLEKLNYLKEIREVVKSDSSDKKVFKFRKDKRIRLTEELLKISQKNNLKSIGVIIGPSCNRYEEYAATYSDALSFIIERFYMELKKENKIGLIVCDSMDGYLEKRVKKRVYDFLKDGELMYFGKSKGKYIKKIYPSVMFLEDDFSSILQLTDLICASLQSAVWNFISINNDLNLLKLKNNEDELIKYNDFLKIYWDLFVKNADGKVSGWGIKTWQ